MNRMRIYNVDCRRVMLTYGLFTSAKPYNVGWVRYIGSAAQNRQDTSQALRAGLGDAEYIEVALSWRPKIWCTVHIKVKI